MRLVTKGRFESDERALFDECERIGPIGIDVLNVGRANFATTYSTAFCEVVADLLFLYESQSVPDPIVRLCEGFCARNIRSCRGVEMTYDRVAYLINSHIAKLPKTPSYRVLDRLVKYECPICGRLKRNVEQHVRDAHLVSRSSFQNGSDRGRATQHSSR